MKPLVVIGVVLIVLGLAALALPALHYTTKETVVDIGPLKAQVEREKSIPVPPALGGAAVLAGLVLVIIGARRR